MFHDIATRAAPPPDLVFYENMPANPTFIIASKAKYVLACPSANIDAIRHINPAAATAESINSASIICFPLSVGFANGHKSRCVRIVNARRLGLI